MDSGPTISIKQKKDIDLEKKLIVIKLNQEEKMNHVFIDDFEGKKRRIKTFELTCSFSIPQQCRLIYYQITADSKFAFFLFAVYNVLIKKGRNQSADLNIVKKSYIIVRKTKEEMIKILASNGKIEVINENEEVLIIKSFNDFSTIKFIDIQEYQISSDDSLKNDDEFSEDDTETTKYQNIELTVPSIGCENDKFLLNFIPFIYQERNSSENKFILFDITKSEATEIISIQPSPNNREFLYEDENGYNSFMICRSSDVFEE